MHWKTIFPFSILFLILIVSLFYFVSPSVLSPLRRDTVSPDTYIVPWMRPDPSIEELNLHAQLPYGSPNFDIDSVMTNSLKLGMIFRIDIANSTRVVSSTVYLGHDSDFLYVGGKFVGMGTNPANIPNGGIGGNFLQILFNVDNEDVLKTPESGSRTSVCLYQERPEALFYYDMVWIGKNTYDSGRPYWEMSENLDDIGIQVQALATIDGAAEYDSSTGTVSVLFARHLRLPSITQVNALQMRPGERWVMGFLLETGFETQTGVFQDYVDGWPRKAYPYLSNDSSWWPRMVIDLSNPPDKYPGNTENTVPTGFNSKPTTWHYNFT
jgi:hypothetical protein